jgi:hypothetical protein
MSGNWHVKGSTGQPDIVFQHGNIGDVVIGCADIFNEGKYRTITWNPGRSTGHWFCKGFGKNSIGNSEDNVIFQHGSPGDIPLVANIFGDGTFVSTYFCASSCLFTHIVALFLSSLMDMMIAIIQVYVPLFIDLVTVRGT